MRKGIIALAFALALVGAGAFAEEAANEPKPIGLDIWAKASMSDVVSGFDLTAKLGATYTAPFGLAVGIDALSFPLYPAPGFGAIGLFEEYDMVFGETGLDLDVGNSNSFGVVGSFSADGYVYTILTYSRPESALASLELDTTYLSANAFSFGLGASAGGGWTFDLAKAGSLKLWLTAYCGIMANGAADFGFTSADLAVSYSYPVGPIKLRLTLDPGIDATAAFSLPISLKATYSL